MIRVVGTVMVPDIPIPFGWMYNWGEDLLPIKRDRR